jgi:hypothetical protein
VKLTRSRVPAASPPSWGRKRVDSPYKTILYIGVKKEGNKELRKKQDFPVLPTFGLCRRHSAAADRIEAKKAGGRANNLGSEPIHLRKNRVFDPGCLRIRECFSRRANSGRSSKLCMVYGISTICCCFKTDLQANVSELLTENNLAACREI